MELKELFTLNEVGTTRSWDYSKPTLQRPGRFTTRSPFSNETFCETFYSEYPSLKKLDWNNVVLRGGAVVDILLDRTPKDLDFFFYGLDAGQVVDKARSLLHFFLHVEKDAVFKSNQRAREHRERTSSRVSEFGDAERIDIQGVRHGCVVSLRLSALATPVQLVLATHASTHEVAALVDMAVCGVFFDGTRVGVSARAKFELENMSIVLQGGFPRQERVAKYFAKGFDIILPELDVARLPRGYLAMGLLDAVQLPRLAFAYRALVGNRIHVESFLSPAASSESTIAQAPSMHGGYSSTNRFLTRSRRSRSRSRSPHRSSSRGFLSRAPASAGASFDARAVLYDNVARLVGGERAHFSVFAEADFIGDVLRPWPQLSARQLTNTFAGLARAVWDGESFNAALYARFVKVVPLAETLTRLAAALSPEAEANVGAAAASPGGVAGGGGTGAAGAQSVVDEAMERQVAVAQRAVAELTAQFAEAALSVPEASHAFAAMANAEQFYGAYRA